MRFRPRPEGTGTGSAGPRSESRIVFALLFLTYAGFFQASTWGAAARFDLARALVERGTVSIDAYHANTGDKALLDGRYYSDKAPLPSYLGAAGVAAAHAVRAATGRPASESVWLALAGGLAAAVASGLATALGGVVFLRRLRQTGATFAAAWGVTFLVFLGTPLFPYATLLQGHAPAAAWLFLVFHLLFPVRAIAEPAPAGTDPPGGPPPVSPRHALLAGGAAAAAVATEYLAGPPLVLIAALALARDPARAAGTLGRLVLGAAPGIVLLGLYHQAAFGSPFDFGYRHVALPFFREKMSAGLFGITAPDPAVAARLLFGPYRGLFFVSPVLLFAAAGMVRLFRDPGTRVEAAAVTGVFLYYLLLNAGYSTWHGGWAIGPRHLVPTLPLLGVALAREWRHSRRWMIPVGAASVLLALAATAVQPEVPEDIAHPLRDHLLPHFARGEFSVGEQGFGDLYPARQDPAQPDRWDAFLIGEALRLPGHLALLPVLLVWVLFSPLGLARRRRPHARAASSPRG